MKGRLLMAVLIVVLIGAPVLTTLCEASCAARSSAAPHSQQHSCHQSAPPSGLQVYGLAHTCGHSSGDDQIGADQAVKVSSHELAVSQAVFALAIPTSPVHAIRAEVAASPPAVATLKTQLRI